MSEKQGSDPRALTWTSEEVKDLAASIRAKVAAADSASDAGGGRPPKMPPKPAAWRDSAEAPSLNADRAEMYRAGLLALREEMMSAFLGAVHRGDPCPFCLARTDNVWPYCVHFKPCTMLRTFGEDEREEALLKSRRERDQSEPEGSK